MAPHYNLKDYYGDVLSVTKDDTIVSLEVYNRFSENEYKKSLCYIARIYGNQLKTKEPYSNAKKVVGISLFNRKIRFNMDNVAEEYKLTEQITRIKTNDEMILFLIDIDKPTKFTYNKCERLRNLAIILKMRWLKDMEKYIENKENEMLEQTVTYVKEFLSNPANHNLIDYHASEVANAKIEGIDETKKAFSKKLLDAGVDKNIVAKCADLSISELDKLLVKN